MPPQASPRTPAVSRGRFLRHSFDVETKSSRTRGSIMESSRASIIGGRVLSGLAIAFLTMDGVMKFIDGIPAVVEERNGSYRLW